MKCRTCRKPPDHQSAVPVEAMLDYHGKSVADMIFELTEIMVTYDQNLPQFICVGCVEDLRSAYNFRQRCIDSNDQFHKELMDAATGETSASDDPNVLVLKVERNDPELLEMTQTNKVEDNLNITPETVPDKQTTAMQRSHRKSRKVILKNIVIDYIKPEEDGRFSCTFDPLSSCNYSQKHLDIGNFIRHCRTKHKKIAAQKGLLTGDLPTDVLEATEENQKQDFVPPNLSDSIPKKKKQHVMKLNWISRKYIKRRHPGFFDCAFDEQSQCRYSQPKRMISVFMRHFRAFHPKKYASVFSKTVSNRVTATTPARQKNKVDLKSYLKIHEHQSKSIFRIDREKVNYTSIVVRFIKSTDNGYHCDIDELSNCIYVQRKLDIGNFIRHFRTKHPMQAEAENLYPKDCPEAIEKKRVIRTISVRTDAPQLLEACLKLVAIHNLPLRCFGWPSLRLILDPLCVATGSEINENCMAEHIHQAARKLLCHMLHEMKYKMISIHIECIVRDENHFLIVSANFANYRKMHSRVLGLIRATVAMSADVLKDKLEQLLNRYHISENQILAIVVGNAGSTLQTHKKLQKTFATSLFEPICEYGEPDQEKILMEAFITELQGQFQVMPNVISTILNTLNEIIPNTDPTIKRIEQFLQDLRNPQYKDYFEKGNATYPPLWHTLRWLSKFKSIRSIIKQEPFFDLLSQHHPELALAESDWHFLHEYHDAFLPLQKLFKAVERSQTKHMAFSDFYMQLLLVIKDVRGLGNRFSKPITEALTERLKLLKERMVFRSALYLDPRFQYFKSIVLTLEQQSDAQNYILNIWNRINTLKPNSQGSLLDADKLKQEDKKDDDMDDFLSEMFGGPSEGTSKAVVPLTSTVTPVLQQLKSLEIEPRQPHDYDVWNHWLQRSISHSELFSVAMVVMSLPSNNVCMERTYSALILADRDDGLTEQTLDELLLIKLNSSLFEKAVVTMYDWKTITRSQGTE